MPTLSLTNLLKTGKLKSVIRPFTRTILISLGVILFSLTPSQAQDSRVIVKAPPILSNYVPEGQIETIFIDEIKKIVDEADEDADIAFGFFQRGLYLSAFVAATHLAEKGDAAAQTLLGELYNGGIGVNQDLEAAASWYEIAANNGNREAAFQLGFMHLDGAGTEKDKAKAAKYFKIAAEKGHVLGLYNTGLMHLSGEALEKDFEKAAPLLLEAAKRGNHDAQFAIAELYSEGKGVERDEILATIYYGKAARGGHDTAELEYADRLFLGKGIGKSEDDAALWYIGRAHKGNALAQNRLAHLYRMGKGVPLDPVTAASWHLISKKQGFEDKELDEFIEQLDKDVRQAATSKADGFKPTTH